MSSPPQTSTPSSPVTPLADESPQVTTHRDLQRSALRDLVSLSAECATTEEKIEQDNRLTLQNEQKRHQKAIADLGEQFNKSREAARAAHTEQIVQVERKFNMHST